MATSVERLVEKIVLARTQLEQAPVYHNGLCGYDPDEYEDKCTRGALKIQEAIDKVIRILTLDD